MADKKITELTGYTSPISTDVLPIVDVTAGVTKKVTKENLTSDKVTANVGITGATKTKITYDAKGLVTSGADATCDDITDGTNTHLVTTAQQTIINNTSGTNTGDEDATSIKTKLGISTLSGSNTGDQDLSGLVAKSTYDANSILYATTDNTPVALTVGASTIVGRKSTGDISALTASEVRTIINVSDGATANAKISGTTLDTGTDDTGFVTAKSINDSHNVPLVAPGTSGNLMTSNGTDWTSAAAPVSVSVTTKGDLQTYSTVPARLPVGTDGQILESRASEATGLKWVAAPSSTDVNAISSPTSDHTASGVKTTLTATANIAFGDVCYIASTGKASLIDADAIATMSGLFMCADATINADASGNFLCLGFARDDSWNWTVGGTIYGTVTGTTGNTLTQTMPTGLDDVVQILGVATHADRMYFCPSLNQVERT